MFIDGQLPASAFGSSEEVFIFMVRANFVGNSHKKSDMRPVSVMSDYLVKLVIPASRAI